MSPKDANKPAPTLLVVDDETDFSFLLCEWLRAKGFDVVAAPSAEGAQESIATRVPDLLIVDVMLENASGIDLVRAIKQTHHDIPVIMISAFGDTQHIIDAMKAGASDYIQKPLDYQEVWAKITSLLSMRSSALTRQSLTGAGRPGDFGAFIGESPRVKQLILDMSKVANSDATVLLRGESGVGKSHIAKLIHDHSPRHDRELVTLNCAAIPETLLETELFGHEKGAFTGALREKIGKFEYADKGTIFLDEIGDLSPELQVKLLRVLQGQEFERVGGLKTIRVDVRIIAATNRNLEKSVQENRFREDLFYRLNVLPIYVPPLRERREDIPALVEHFLAHYAQKTGKKFRPVPAGILKRLTEYDWPGNIRELQNVIERAVVLGIAPNFNPADFVLNSAPQPVPPPSTESATTPPAPLPAPSSPALASVADLRYRRLVEALEQSHGNVSEAAARLGVGRATLYRRMKKYGISLK